VLSYRLLWFEPEPPERYPRLALAAVTTHDLPTVAGLWSRDDIAAQRLAGLDPNVEGFALIRERLAQLPGLSETSTPEEVIERTYGALAQAPSLLLTATLEDALGVVERPNMPSTVDQWPNWSLALPRPLEDLERAELPQAIASQLRRT
jgi:4-alpha-glucanotransferase